MNLYIIRHADAGDSSLWSGDDSLRPLTEHGRKQAKALGESFRRLGVSLDAIVSSPYVRTRETAEGIIEGLGASLEVSFSELLAAGAMRRSQLAEEIAGLKPTSAAIVGHDPDMPEFLGWLLGLEPKKVFLKKGAAAFVQCRTPTKGDASLGWLVTPTWYLGGAG
jgi:phosphohistidine phosphatase